MRELVLTAPGRVGWRTTPSPELSSPRGALVRPLAVATCDFDHLLSTGRMSLPGPIALGHEAVGVVQEVGEQVHDVRVGDLVVIPFQVSCGECETCRHGLTSACLEVGWLSCYGLGRAAGGYGGLVSDSVLVPYADAMLVPLPAGVTAEAAASVSCNIVDAYRCVGPQLRARPGASVLVVGGAFANIALYSALLAQGLSARSVTLLTEDADLRTRAEALGLRTVGSLGAEDRHEITIDAAQDPRLLELAVRATAPGGTLTVSPMYVEGSVPLPLMAMFERCLTLTTGQPHARAHVPAVLDLIGRGVIDPMTVVTDVVDWDDAPGAFSRGAGKAVVSRPE